ncbi:hypothetical protein N9901_01915, partial [Flavobacteriaceae bacterium]|nr:hypothetical protein [Flavobacteriaceae bacterium]
FVFAQNTGDISFVGFNADGDDDFSIVTFVDISPNTTVYFTDATPNSFGTGKETATSEGTLVWSTGSQTITAGTVVVFTDVVDDSNPLFGVSHGAVVDHPSDAGFNISASGDAIYATLGDPTTNSVGTWLAGIQNKSSYDTNFNATGLIVGDTFVEITSPDGGEYNGTRDNKHITKFRELIANEDNWEVESSNGEAVLPFNSSVFTMSSLGVTSIDLNNNIVVQLLDGSIIVSEGNIIAVYNLFGQRVLNKNLQSAVYIVEIAFNSTIIRVKVLG